MNRRDDAWKFLLEEEMLYEVMKNEPLKYFYSDLLERIEHRKVTAFPDLENILKKVQLEEASDHALGCIEITRGRKDKLTVKVVKGWVDYAYDFSNIFLEHFLEEKSDFDDYENFIKNNPKVGDKGFFTAIAKEYYNNTKFCEISKKLRKVYEKRNRTHNRRVDKYKYTLNNTYKRFKKYEINQIFKYLKEAFDIIDKILKDEIKLTDRGSSGSGYFIHSEECTTGEIIEVEKDDDKKKVTKIIIKVTDKFNNTFNYYLIKDDLLNINFCEIDDDYKLGSLIEIKRIGQTNNCTIKLEPL